MGSKAAVVSAGRVRRVRRHDGSTSPPSPFSAVLCALDGSRGSAEAARQAVALSGPATNLGFVAVTHSSGTGLSAQADIGETRIAAALEDAAARARRAGIGATTELLHGGRVSDRLLKASRECDLLALGCHGGSRIGGIMLGATATQIAHRAEVPLLIARRSVDFPREVMLASDGSPGSWAALRVAVGVARANDSNLQVAYVPDGHPERYRELFKQVTEIERLTGVTPTFTDLPGDPARRLAETAQATQSSLIVIGKRGLHGVRALGSVSERLAHRAPCSVLVAPPAARLAEQERRAE